MGGTVRKCGNEMEGVWERSVEEQECQREIL